MRHLVIEEQFPDLSKNEISEAIDSYEWAIAYRPEFVQALNNLGNAQSDLGLYDQAIKNYHKALSLNSNYLEPLLNLGVAQQHLGLDDKAAESFDKLLKLQPLNLKAFRNLSTVKRFTKKDSNKIKKYESLLDNKDFSKSDLVHLYQGLSKAYEDLGDIDKQFNYLKEGNNIRKNLLNYSIENSINLFSKIKTI